MLIAILATALLAQYFKPSENESSAKSYYITDHHLEEWEIKTNLADKYLESKKKNPRKILASDSSVKDLSLDPRFARICSNVSEYYLELFMRYKDLDPLAARIAATFTKVEVKAFEGEYDLAACKSQKDNQNYYNQESDTLLVYLLPQDKLDLAETPHGIINFSSCYDAIFYPAIIWTGEPFLNGMMMHEAGHALLELEGKHKDVKLMDKEYPLEEVEMQRLESLVVNQDSNEKFYEYIDQIIVRESSAKDVYDVMSSLDFNDLAMLDSITDSSNCNIDQGRMMHANYVFSIAFRYYKGKMIGQQKLDLFSWIAGMPAKYYSQK
jgi:hypothetical protein